MKLIKYLGYAGLLPFALLPLAYHLQWYDSAQLVLLYQLYSALILGFMAGVLWPVLYHQGPVLHQQEQSGTQASYNSYALLAVSFPVVSIIGLALLPGYFLLLQALLFVLLRLAECTTAINRRYSNGYQSLRNALTLVVTVSHLVMFTLLNT